MHRRWRIVAILAALAPAGLAGCLDENDGPGEDPGTEPRYGRETPEDRDGVTGQEPIVEQVVEEDGAGAEGAEGGGG